MPQPSNGPSEASSSAGTVTTPGLLLSPVGAADIDDLYAMHSDPRVWTHLPAARHDRIEQTQRLVDVALEGWAANGLDYWSVRLGTDGEGSTVLGMGGCSLRAGRAWNLYYRLHPDIQGHGYAQQLIGAARASAAAHRPELPVVAYLLEHNVGSRRAAERAGLQLVWNGPDAGNPNPAAVRLIYADRPVDDETLHAFSG
ncbi:hypothetical protein ASC66_09110 [Leifsonia sp. Root4]|nr:hypothetical protein ASC66_09110 [Leifsonia sp. Root4]